MDHRPMMGKLGRVAWAWYLALGAVLGALYFILSPSLSKLIIWPAIGWSSVIAIVVGTRMHKSDARSAWYLLAIGAALFAGGDNLYTFRSQIQHLSNDMFPSYVDGLYLAMYPFMI